MKKMTLALAALMTATSVFGIQRAFYVKQGDTYTKYNFGVASDLVFSNNGHNLTVSGYHEVIDLDKIDYITFNAPVNTTAITPAAQKEKLVKIGKEVLSKVDLNRVDDLMRAIYVFSNHYEDNNGQEHCPCTEYEVPKEYWDVHNAFNAIREAGKVYGGEFAAIRALQAKAVDLYKASDYYGIYTADPESKTWKKTGDTQGVEIRYLSQDNKTYFRVRLTCSDTYTTWTTSDFECQAPTRMMMTIYYGDKELATATIDTKIVQDTSITMNVVAQADKYVVKSDMQIVDKAITENVLVTIDGEYLTSADTTINGSGLLTYDTMKNAIKDSMHHHDADGNCIDGDPNDLFAHLFRASSKADILKQLQIDGRIFEFQTLYNSLSDDPDYTIVKNGYESTPSYGKVTDWNPSTGIICVDESNPECIDSQVQHLSNYSDIQFFYDGTKTIQGFMSWDRDEYTYDNVEWWNDGETSGYAIVDGYLHYVSRNRDVDYKEIFDEDGDPCGYEEIVTYGPWHYWVYGPDGSLEVNVDEKDIVKPTLMRLTKYSTISTLVFPDLTSFSFEDYFDENSFKGLTDDCDDLVETYKKICGIKDER